MNEKNKLIITIVAGLAVIIFVFTNFCLPLMRDTATRIDEYNTLKAEVETLSGADEKSLAVMEKKLKASIAQLEEKFSSREKFKFVQQLTNSAKNTDVTFADIDRKDPQAREGYEEFPVDASMTASFKDFMRYLLVLEQSPRLIGIRSLTVRKNQGQPPVLDIRVAFSGFNLMLKPVPYATYLEKKYTPLDYKRIEELLTPLKSSDNQTIIAQLANANPFVSDYDSKQSGPIGDGQNSGVNPNSVISSLSLQGILHVHNEKAALINDTVVKENETINGAVVVAIGDDKVTLRYLDKDYTLTMGVDNAFIH